MSTAAIDILIWLDWEPPWRDELETRIKERFPSLRVRTVSAESDARALLRDAKIFMSFGYRIPDDLFEDASHLEWIQSLGSGVDGLLNSPSRQDGVVVTATRGIHGAALSETVLTFMLTLSRDFRQSFECQTRREWSRWRMDLLAGKTVGIVGVGQIAEALAPRCAAMGMKVVGVSAGRSEVPGFHQIVPYESVYDAVSAMDYLVVMASLTEKTRGFVGEKLLSSMKSSAFLINVARGAIVDEAALIKALDADELAGAGLDVFNDEPLPPDHPLWSHKKVLITPHIGGFYKTYMEDAAQQITANIERYLRGDLAGMLNREA